MLFDFSNCENSGLNYGGSERKIGILVNNEPYLLKFRKRTAFGLRFNHVSEYLGSHIFELLGFNVHKTILGIYKNEEVVACKDFTSGGYLFVPFNDVGESSIEEDKDTYQYSYEDIVKLLRANKKLTNVEETVSSFFEIYIVDALIGNFDRHGANWGFLKKDNKYYLASVFDNGSSLFSQISDEQIVDIIDNEEEINRRIYEFPTSQIQLDGKKSSYFDVISSLRFEECNKALLKVFPKVDLEKFNVLIDSIEIISDTRKTFLKKMLKERYEKIIKFSYEKLMEEQPKWTLLKQKE